MANFCKVTINLSANAVDARYTVSYSTSKITKETDKTVVVRKHFGTHRYMKSELMQVQTDRKNDKLSLIQFFTLCYEDKLDEAIILLQEVMKQKVEELTAENQRAIDAFNSECKVTKN